MDDQRDYQEEAFNAAILATGDGEIDAPVGAWPEDRTHGDESERTDMHLDRPASDRSVVSRNVLTDAEVATLTAARVALERIEDRRRIVGGAGDGRLMEACDAAGRAIFRVLNVANAHCGANLTYAQLHKGAKPKASA